MCAYFMKPDMSYYTNFSSDYMSYWSFGSGKDGNGSLLYYEDVIYDLTTKLITDYQKWVFSIIGCLLVGLSGIFPLLLIPRTRPSSSGSVSHLSTSSIANGKDIIANGTCKMKDNYNSSSPATLDICQTGIGPKNLKRLLSFAVGSLLGDVFLHLLPEAWLNARNSGLDDHAIMQKLGIWILIGIVSFLVCEMLVSNASERHLDVESEVEFEAESDSYSGDEDEGHVEGDEDSSSDSETARSFKNSPTNNNVHKNKKMCNGNAVMISKVSKEASQKHIAGYLNLVANSFDNFTHGLAVAGSFIISPKIGTLTTLAILLHEIPHEIGDFAILLRSGFNPWSAAKAQLSTATVGLFGAIFTLSVDSMKTIGDYTWWILPYTSGCFINIALSNLLPDLMKETDPKESCLQFISLIFGIVLMGLVTMLVGC